MGWLIGIGGNLTAPALPHHRTYGSRIRRFDELNSYRGARFGSPKFVKKRNGNAIVNAGVLNSPLAPDASRLISGFCSSSRSFGLDFLQTPPHDDALALLLAFGSTKTWP